MKEVVLDTETTGLEVKDGHRIVEIGCIELENQIPTNKIFHEYLNPQRSVSEDAYKIHGYSDNFLSDKKTFSLKLNLFLNLLFISLLFDSTNTKMSAFLLILPSSKSGISNTIAFFFLYFLI